MGRSERRLTQSRPRRAVPEASRIQSPPPDARLAYLILDFALRAGGMMLSSGAATTDVEATILELAHCFGLDRCEVDVTFTSMTASYVGSNDERPITAVQVVRKRTVDYHRLGAIHALRSEVAAGRLTPAEAFSYLDSLDHAPSRRHLLVLGSWAGMAAAFTVLLGGKVAVAITAFLSTSLVYGVNRWLYRRGIPDFFLSAIGAAIATAVALILSSLAVPANPSLVVAGGITVLVPGYALVASVYDALTGFPISGGARGLEVALTAAGIITGVATSLYVASTAGATLHLAAMSLTPLVQVPIQVAAAGVAAALYGAATSVPRRSLPAAGLVGALGWASFLFLIRAGGTVIVSTAIAAVAVGVLSHLVAMRTGTHPFLFLVPGVMPLVPGLTIYEGMFELFTGQGSGPATLFRALGIGLAIAAGVTLGNLLLRPVRRPLQNRPR